MRDVRLALRTLHKAPGPTAVVVGTLAVAIAAGTVVYSTIDVVYHLLPIANRDALVFIASVDERRSVGTRLGLSVPDLADLSRQSTTIEAFAGFALESSTLTGGDPPIRVSTVRATPNLTAMWGLRAAGGRLFTSDDGRPNAPAVAVLSYRFWQRQFSSNLSAIGGSVLLNGEPHTIIGVLTPDASVGAMRDRDLFLPLRLETPEASRDVRNLFVTARLRDGASLEESAAEISWAPIR